MTNEMNKWMEFSNEYAQLINENFQVMNKFWNATLEQNNGYTKKNMELFFDHMNRNVELMYDIYNNITGSNEELQKIYRENIEKFNTRYQNIYEETIKAVTPKTAKAGK
jgi:predicted nucleotidyltransferase